MNAKENGGKLSVEGKKIKGKKAPPPPSDKERFDSLFDVYCTWGNDSTSDQDKGLTAMQLTKWLKNVNIVDGKKVIVDKCFITKKYPFFTFR